MSGRSGSGFTGSRTEGNYYDADGNRTSKTTPLGTIYYRYDSENRLTKQLEFTYQGSSRNDKGRNFILEKNSLGTDKTYTIDALEVYTVRRGYKVK